MRDPGGHSDLAKSQAGRRRLPDQVVTTSDSFLEEAEQAPLPDGLTPHSLRRTFASLQVAVGEDPRYVMAQLGHTDPAFTLRVYAQAMRRDESDRERLRALVEGADWAPMGTSGPEAVPRGAEEGPVQTDESGLSAGDSEDGRG